MQKPELLPNPGTQTGETPTKDTGTDYNLLRQPLISVNHEGKTAGKTLPEVYAALVNDQVEDFPSVRPHQRHFWHATLCQIGTIAMVNADRKDPPETPEEWTEIIRALTQEEFPSDEPWCLVTADINKPAFLQPPVSVPAKATGFSKRLETPDVMDLPVGSKHHDVRESSIRRATPELWLFALVARQTGGGFDGNRLYGISRMNSGAGNRHAFSLTPSTRPGPHAGRDLQVLSQLHRGQDVSGLLMWTRQWNGTKQEEIPLHTLTPQALYVEISRRIRLEADSEGKITGRYATSESARVHAKEAKGMTQDPWTITEADKAVTVGNAGFGYRQVTRYLDPNKYKLPALAKQHQTDGNADMLLIARTVVRGNGKTEGYHERSIPLNRKAAGMFQTATTQAQLHQVADERLGNIGEVQSILGHAVKTYLQGGKSDGKTRNEHQGVINNARRSLDQAVDRSFWQDLQEELESEEPRKTRWEWASNTLVPEARAILQSIHRSNLCRHTERYKATTQALDLFDRRIANSKKLPEKPREKEESTG